MDTRRQIYRKPEHERPMVHILTHRGAHVSTDTPQTRPDF